LIANAAAAASAVREAPVAQRFWAHGAASERLEGGAFSDARFMALGWSWSGSWAMVAGVAWLVP